VIGAMDDGELVLANIQCTVCGRRLVVTVDAGHLVDERLGVLLWLDWQAAHGHPAA